MGRGACIVCTKGKGLGTRPELGGSYPWTSNIYVPGNNISISIYIRVH